MYDSMNQCHICRKEYTSMHVEVKPGIIIFACSSCLEKAKEHFIWVCIHCGKSYFRSKEQVIGRLKGYGMEHAALLCNGAQLILGIDMCIACNPEGIVRYVQSTEQQLDPEPCGH